MTISVITSTYNHARYLTECVESFFNQEIEPLEAIIIDDASTDHTQDVIRSLSARFPKIVAIRNETNQGPALNLNKAIALAKGEYIVGCAADDFLLPGIYQKGLDFLTQNRELGFCFGDTWEFQDGAPREFLLRKPMQSEASLRFDPNDVRALFKRRQLVIPSHSTMYRRSCMLEQGGFIPGLKSICDWYLNMCIAFRSGFGYIPHPLSAFRHTPGSYARSVYRDSQSRKIVLDCLFERLEKEENRWIREAFQSCGLFAYFNYRFFYDLLAQPRYWRLAWRSFPKKLKFLIHYRLSHLLQR
jgi:glycosyltransferase involved in cell wall biosynthesis